MFQAAASSPVQSSRKLSEHNFSSTFVEFTPS